MKIRSAFLVTILFSFWTMPTMAETIAIAPSAQGFYIDDGYHSHNLNYVVEVVGDTEWRNYFTFDLSNITGTILSATFQVYTWENLTDVTYELREFGETGISPNILSSYHSQGIAVFNDLGNGLVYGSAELGPNNSNSTIQIALNENAINRLNGTETIFAFGGKGYYHNFVSHQNGPQGAIFGYSGLHADNLLILNVVPEPTTLSLLFGGMLTCLFVTLRKRASSTNK